MAGEPADHALGHSRSGLTTKIHLAADPRCRPMVLLLSPGQAGDAPHFPLVIGALRVPPPLGRPRTRPEHSRERKIRAVIPQPAD